jgi:predicted RNA-binding protein with PIN domain
MILVIDGYNIIHAIKKLELTLKRGLKEARASLISFCIQLFSVRCDIEKIYIVFDGTSDLYCSEESPHPKIRILYTPTGEDADDRIIEILRAYTGKSQVTVVTNDNYVANNARSLRAKILSASEFERYSTPRKFPNQKTSEISPGFPEVSANTAKDITEEYKKFLGIR